MKKNSSNLYTEFIFFLIIFIKLGSTLPTGSPNLNENATNYMKDVQILKESSFERIYTFKTDKDELYKVIETFEPNQKRSSNDVYRVLNNKGDCEFKTKYYKPISRNR